MYALLRLIHVAKTDANAKKVKQLIAHFRAIDPDFVIELDSIFPPSDSSLRRRNEAAQQNVLKHALAAKEAEDKRIAETQANTDHNAGKLLR